MEQQPKNELTEEQKKLIVKPNITKHTLIKAKVIAQALAIIAFIVGGLILIARGAWWLIESIF